MKELIERLKISRKDLINKSYYSEDSYVIATLDKAIQVLTSVHLQSVMIQGDTDNVKGNGLWIDSPSVKSGQPNVSVIDNELFNKRNYFQTKEEAESMAEKTKLMFEMTARVKELNGDWVADWEDKSKSKFGIKLYSNKCIIDWYNESNNFIFGLSVQSEKHVKILLEEFKERIERWY